MNNLRTLAWVLGLVVLFVVIGWSADDTITTTERENLRQLQVLNGRLGVQYMQVKDALEKNASQINVSMDRLRGKCGANKQDFDNELIKCKDKPASSPKSTDKTEVKK